MIGAHRGLVARRREQGGFALMAVLALIALTSLIIAALLGLLITTIRTTTAQEQTARETRAADGAIEAAIQKMRTQPCATSGTYLSGLGFDQGTISTGDDVRVDVSCSSSGGAAAATDQVRLVGTGGYQGAVPWSTNCAGAATVPTCFPWSATLGATPAGLAASRPQLVHSGPKALRFASGVTVRGSASGLGTKATGVPAFSVGGQYAQGAPGLGATGSNACGLLSPTVGDGSSAVSDLDSTPSCDDANARNVDASPTEAASGIVASTDTAPPIPDCSGPVVSFQQGTYDATLTSAVNALLDSASCRNKTFHFQPGVYAFEGDSLKLADPGSFYVFGAPKGWTDAGGGVAGAIATDPNAQLCDPEASGTTLVLAARTRILHTGGRVAICPAHSDPATSEAYPAIYQETSAPNQPVLTGATVVSNSFFDIGNLMDADPANATRAVFQCADFAASPCWSTDRSFSTTWSTQGRAALTSAVVSFDSSEQYPVQLIDLRRVRFRVYSGATLICTVTRPGLPNSYQTGSYNLLDADTSGTAGAGCAGKLTTEGQLDGARIEVTPQYRFTTAYIGLGKTTQTLYVRSISLATNLWSASGTTVQNASTVARQWDAPDNVLTADASLATGHMTCADTVCPVAKPSTGMALEHELTLNDITVAVPPSAAPYADSAHLTSLAVTADIDTPKWLVNSQALLPNGSVRIDVRLANNATCTAPFAGYVNSPQRLRFDLLKNSGCQSILSDVRQLTGASVTMTVITQCVPDILNATFNLTQCWQVKPFSISHLQLVLTTDLYSGPPPTSTVNVDATTTASSSSFNVFGETWMPLTDLDIHWKGNTTAAPLFGSDLVLYGLGSDMTSSAQMGVVCCSPPESRTVDLTAKIVGGTDRLKATVEFTDVVDNPPAAPVYSPGISVKVLGWQTCSAAGCAALGVPGP